MAGLWWMTVTLVFFLSAGSLAVVDQNQLAGLIQGIKKEYQISGMFSLAVSLKSEDPDNLKELFEKNPKGLVQEKLVEDGVYNGDRLAVAKVKQPEHAEWRLLKDLKLVSNTGDFLAIYSYASACPTTCTNTNNPYNIIKVIKNVIEKGHWSKYVFVFEKVFKPQGSDGIEENELIKALTELGKSKITLPDIFRCYKPVNSVFQCISCSTGGKVTKQCIDYNA